MRCSSEGRGLRARVLLPILSAVLLLGALAAPREARADINPVFLALGGLKTPGVAFDVLGAARVGPHLEVFDGMEGVGQAARASFTANVVTLGLHLTSITAFGLGAFADDWKDVVGPVLLVNAAADGVIAVLGMTTGVDILVRRDEIEDEDLRAAAIWSGAVNVAMAGFGILWFAPELIGAMVGISELASVTTPTGRLALRIEPWGAGAMLSGRW